MPEGRWVTTKHGQRVFIGGGPPGQRKVAVAQPVVGNRQPVWVVYRSGSNAYQREFNTREAAETWRSKETGKGRIIILHSRPTRRDLDSVRRGQFQAVENRHSR